MLRKFIDYAPEYQDVNGIIYIIFLQRNMNPFSSTLRALKLKSNVDREQARKAVLWTNRADVLQAYGEIINFEFSYFKRFNFIIQLSLKWPTLIILLGLFAFVGVKIGLTAEFYLLCALHLPWAIPLTFCKLSPLPEPEIKSSL